jgi:methylenetetrahydrofolate dehydrogenase (NADP+)/methenyltetrahydrofolate cyclohydrolase
MKTLDGRILRDRIANKLKLEVSGLKVKPVLAIIQVGDNVESNVYIKQKKLFGERIGAVVNHIRLPKNISFPKIEKEIKKLNSDRKVHGIIIQLPIPENLDARKITKVISPSKDVDGLVSGSNFTPATTRGILSILDFYKINLAGKRAVVVGRSDLVGKPTALALLNKNATVTIAHSKSKNLKQITKSAEVLVVAVGRPKFINDKYVSKGQVVIDVGINKTKNGLVGDVDFEKVKKIVRAITPVPGGVGVMTVASLFENLFDAARLKFKR